ncbi:MAG: hypothetical protein V3V25_03825 [Paracoccaceae bacterium]
MTALKDFDRLESTGIWQPTAKAQRRNVILAVGNATLTISDHQETAIAHWSLPAIDRINPGVRPAIYRPGPDADDILEIDDETMIQAIAQVQTAIERQRPHPGRLRLAVVVSSVVLFSALAIFWLPGAMISYTASVVPDTKRSEIGESLLTNIRRISGKPCNEVLGVQALQRLRIRLFGDSAPDIAILSGGVKTVQHLPGNIILLNRSLVEDHEEVDVVAGFLLVEQLRMQKKDPLVQLLQNAGFSTSFRLLTTGNIPENSLGTYAETLLVTAPDSVAHNTIIDQFSRANIRTSPYAYAVDISGETTIALIESDTVDVQQFAPILDDSDWVSLQGICGE